MVPTSSLEAPCPPDLSLPLHFLDKEEQFWTGEILVPLTKTRRNRRKTALEGRRELSWQCTRDILRLQFGAYERVLDRV